jgi:hypothetical protein
MTTPSRFHIVSLIVVPFADEARLLAALVAADVDAVDDHAGHVFSAPTDLSTCGVPSSSAVVSVVDVPTS